MCLSVPAQISKIEGENAEVTVGGAKTTANIRMVGDVEVGDYILVHAGFAIQKISEEEALETLKTFDEFEELNQQLDEEEKQTGKRIV
ncbi:MAG: HypC/HybG/HupF family hydrogenase formation chaperone [Marinilabiliales bacterium]|nr:MAG: HypC/HybG/HupF family hydrogenase formation chaperone [Marinilabiliales bacterium]